MAKSAIDRLIKYLENVAVWSFMLTVGLIFVVAAAVTLTFVWAYTRH